MAASRKRAAKKVAPKRARRPKKRVWKPKVHGEVERLLGLTFLRLRNAKGFSMRAMARAIGCAVNTVRWHEAGATPLRADNLYRAAAVLMCDPGELLKLADHEDDIPVNGGDDD